MNGLVFEEDRICTQSLTEELLEDGAQKVVAVRARIRLCARASLRARFQLRLAGDPSLRG